MDLKSKPPIFINGFLLVFSIYLIWGWLTLSDIRTECAKRGLDYNDAITALIVRTEELPGMTNEAKIVVPSGPFGRLAYASAYSYERSVEKFTTNSSDATNATSETKDTYWIIHTPLQPFFQFSENVANCVFSFGLGYVLSTVLILARSLSVTRYTRRFLILRPLAGGLASASLFLVVIAGGNFVWQNVSAVNPLSLGLIAAIGSLWCDRFSKLLTSVTTPGGST